MTIWAQILEAHPKLLALKWTNFTNHEVYFDWNGDHWCTMWVRDPVDRRENDYFGEFWVSFTVIVYMIVIDIIDVFLFHCLRLWRYLILSLCTDINQPWILKALLGCYRPFWVLQFGMQWINSWSSTAECVNSHFGQWISVCDGLYLDD